MNISGKGTVIPSGAGPKYPLSAGSHTIKIIGMEPANQIVKVEYPDGFQKNHQAGDMKSLFLKVAALINSRYDIETFRFGDTPAFKVGAEIQLLEVK